MTSWWLIKLIRLPDWSCRLVEREKIDHILFPIAGGFAELEGSMMNGRTNTGIEKAKLSREKSGRKRVSINSETAYKSERIKNFLTYTKAID